MIQGKSKGLRNFLYAAGVATAGALSGCQSMDIKSFRNPGVNGWDDEGGNYERALNTITPRTYNQSAKVLGDNAKRIPADLAYVVSRVPAVIGVDPAYGNYFGQHRHKGIFGLKNSSSWRYKPNVNYSGGKKPVLAAFFNIIDTPIDIIGGLSNLVEHVYKGPVIQPINMGGILPLTANTSKRQEIYDDKPVGIHKPENDDLKFWIDGASDIIKVPVKTALYLPSNGRTMPSTLRYEWNRLRQWLGYNIGNRNEPLELKFFNPDTLDRKDYLRMAVNTLPFAGNAIDKLGWGYTHRKEKGEEKKVVDTIDGRIPLQKNLDDDNKLWNNRLGSVGRETSAPGVIVHFNPELKTAEATTLAIFKALFGAGVFLINYGGGVSGTAGSTSGIENLLILGNVPGVSGGTWGNSPGVSGGAY